MWIQINWLIFFLLGVGVWCWLVWWWWVRFVGRVLFLFFVVCGLGSFYWWWVVRIIVGLWWSSRGRRWSWRYNFLGIRCGRCWLFNSFWFWVYEVAVLLFVVWWRFVVRCWVTNNLIWFLIVLERWWCIFFKLFCFWRSVFFFMVVVWLFVGRP